MSRIRSILVPVAALAVAAAVVGCGGSAKDETSAATTTTSTVRVPVQTTTTTATTSDSTAATTTNQKTVTDITDAEVNTGGARLGKESTLQAVAGALKVTLPKFYDPVHSVSNFDPAPKGSRYIGVTVRATFTGNQADTVSSVDIVATDGTKFPLSLLADPDCGHNLVNVGLIGVGAASRGCVVALAPKGVKAKSVVIELQSGKDRSKLSTATIPIGK